MAKIGRVSMDSARVTDLALRVWASEEDARMWLSSPHIELACKTPNSLLNSVEGTKAVEALLAALESGFPV